ncbi:MFS transporter [Jeotgalibacillus sp. S-D1]|uniref:MFS transporter n=1 Tax=Jeotgalibacillus sp. S-D1 TaxID=2552189 RepID=UPI00105A9528|nr:MFS transporter [Jeotgalibacillus sp. S-D1]TDL30868.1 MFS transporter [Jeotgalibacillus sp. S-D1]
MGKTSFRFLWTGQTAANAGDILYIAGLISVLYIITGSAVYMAMLPFFSMAARFLSALIAPLLLDRFQLEKLLAVSQLGKTAVLFVLSIFLHFYMREDTVSILFIFVIAIAFLDGWASPARNALLPRLVEKNELVKANSFIAVIDQTVQLGMWPLGAVLVSIIGATWVVWITFILYILSTLFMLMIVRTEKTKRKNSSTGEEENQFKGFKEGWKTIWTTPYLLLISVTEVIESSANVVWIAAIMYVYVAEVLHAGEAWWGYINASFFAGLLIGGILGLKYAQLLESHIKRIISAGAVVLALVTLVFGFLDNAFIALFLSAVFGFASQLKGIAQQTLIQTNVREALLPKVYSAQEAAYFASFGVSTLLFGYLTDLHGARFIFFLSAGLLLLSSVLLILYRGLLEKNQHLPGVKVT